MIDLSIVIPAYKEESRIGQSIRDIDQWIQISGVDAEVLIIVEPSPDRTLEVARDEARKCLNSKCFNVVDNRVHKGKGYAVRCGINQSQGTVKMFMDADLSVPLGEINKALDYLQKNPSIDILIGSRHDGGTVVKKQGLIRRFGSRGYNLLLRTMGLTGIRDTQCGFKLFRKRAAGIFEQCQIDGFGFDIEVLMIGRKSGYQIAQIPVVWYNSDRSSFDPVKDGLKVLIEAFQVWRRLS